MEWVEVVVVDDEVGVLDVVAWIRGSKVVIVHFGRSWH